MTEPTLPPLPDLVSAVVYAPSTLEKSVREYGAACVREERQRINDAISDALQSDLENGVKWLSKRAAEKFGAEYPELNKALAAIAGDAGGEKP